MGRLEEYLIRVIDYVIDVLIALDQLINTIFGGYPDETFSASCYRKRYNFFTWWICYKVVNLCFFWQDDHCKRAYESEVNNEHLPSEYM